MGVWSCFQTLRTKVGAAEFFDESSMCLETWSNSRASVWYNFSNKYVLQEKTKEKVWLIYASVWSHFQTCHTCDFPVLASWTINKFEKKCSSCYFALVYIDFLFSFLHWLVIVLYSEEFNPLKKLSELMLCAPSNHRWPFVYHMKMADFECSHVLSIFLWKQIGIRYTQKSVLRVP